MRSLETYCKQSLEGNLLVMNGLRECYGVSHLPEGQNIYERCHLGSCLQKSNLYLVPKAVPLEVQKLSASKVAVLNIFRLN